MPPLGIILGLSWGAFMLVWLIGALRAKREADRGGSWWEQKPILVARIAMAAALIVMPRFLLGDRDIGEHDALLFYPSSALAWAAALFTVSGIAFAIWARVHLGANWSPRPSRKQEHELVTTGPYQFVRHPIYTGVLIAIVGLVCTGSLTGSVMLVILFIVLVRRIIVEERIMMELFPDCYSTYRRGTWRLIPCVW